MDRVGFEPTCPFAHGISKFNIFSSSDEGSVVSGSVVVVSGSVVSGSLASGSVTSGGGCPSSSVIMGPSVSVAFVIGYVSRASGIIPCCTAD
jgi:hypothetical protein